MVQKVLPLLFFLFSISVIAQIEKYPVFKNCDSLNIDQLEACFKAELKKAVLNEFKVPENMEKDKFKGTVNVVFLLNSEGEFKAIYVNSPYKELKEEVERVFNSLPKITPAKYNNRPIEMEFVLPLKIPLIDNFNFVDPVAEEKNKVEVVDNTGMQLTVQKHKKDSLYTITKTLYPEHRSELNIPLVHTEYNSFDYYMNLGENTHTSVKPYLYSELSPNLDLDVKKSEFSKVRKTWGGRKLWNEHLLNIQGKDFWITLDLPLDLEVGKDSEGVSTFNNTRALQVNGGIGKQFNFSTVFYESQGRFAEYFNDYARLIKPDGGNPAIIPGRGIAKDYKTDAFDYPVAEAHISYTPSKYFNFQLGNGKNFIGDGYRSMFLSDVASPLPYFKINTTFWKIKYTNIWMWAQDVRKELTEDGAYRKKYIAAHYLSLNITKRFNIGLFEAAIWDNSNDRGMDVGFLNPLIFYTAIEFATGTRAGNAILGLSLKYKFDKISLYSQITADELRFSEVFSGSGWWGNKFGFQIGAKFFHAFNVDNLYFQVEYNQVRPYTFSHDELNYNYGHNNQPLAHLWGSNFREAIGIARYTWNRWFLDAKVVVGTKGFDYNTAQDSYSYGGDIYKDNDDRLSDYDNEIGQGIKTSIFVGDLQVGYLVNPATNLKLFASITYRNFEPATTTEILKNTNSTWFAIGLKADLFNWYFDF